MGMLVVKGGHISQHSKGFRWIPCACIDTWFENGENSRIDTIRWYRSEGFLKLSREVENTSQKQKKNTLVEHFKVDYRNTACNSLLLG